MRLHFLGGAGIVTGNSYLLETDKEKILIDCGLFQGLPELEAKNREPFPFDPKEIDFVLITHSHLDHIGRLPLLVEGGFSGKIFATPPTMEFARLMLEDTQKVMYEKARKEEGLIIFGENEIQEIMDLFVPTPYHQKINLSENVSFEFFEAGHILGSAIIRLTIRRAQGKNKKEKKETKIVFSGDLGNTRMPILRPLEKIEEANYVLVESTYGDRLHEDKSKTKDIVEDVVEETIAKNGVLMIPSFALERTQQLLYQLNELVEHKRIPVVPVFIDSPLAIKVTAVYEKYRDYFNQEARQLIKSGDDIFKFPGLKMTPSIKESKQINDVLPPKIIIAGSGMSQGGRIMHHELRYLSEARNTLLLVSYQAQGTLGRQILDGAKEVKILDQQVAVQAKITHISGYSAHADQAGLMDWVAGFQKPVKKIFVVQGEEKPANVLAQKIKDELGISAEVPKINQVVELV